MFFEFSGTISWSIAQINAKIWQKQKEQATQNSQIGCNNNDIWWTNYEYEEQENPSGSLEDNNRLTPAIKKLMNFNESKRYNLKDHPLALVPDDTSPVDKRNSRSI